MGNKFWELLERSVIFQGVLVVMVGGTVCYLYATGQDVPRELQLIFAVIIGFFFGGKPAAAAHRQRVGQVGG